MTTTEIIDDLKQQYSIIDCIDLNPWFNLRSHLRQEWIRQQLMSVYQLEYENDQRIVFTLTSDAPETNYEMDVIDLVIDLLQQINEVDISNFFIILITNNQKIIEQQGWLLEQVSADPVPVTIIPLSDSVMTAKQTNYNSADPIKISLNSLHEKEKFLLTKSKTFCMYPWIHLHAYPTGDAYPCCMFDMAYPVGNTRKNTLENIWNNDEMKTIRLKMINDEPINGCERCYEKEKSGFFSGRQSANKHHGHHVHRATRTNVDGSLDEFKMVYWDIRFSNLCNLSCRSCGHIFSSSWYQDQIKLAGPEWKLQNAALNYAGRTETDIWEQLIPHLDYVEQIYFAGGEPLLMAEHYNILDELERRGRFDVRLIYNTNFTHTQLKNRSVFDYWKKFDSVSVGASLDASGARAEYIRKGTDWKQVEENRKEMLRVCPQVDFYISPTLSIMNALHLPDFHRDWVERGLIKPQDLNVNVLQDPVHYRIDIAPYAYKEQIKEKFQSHIEWLRPHDHLQRATIGFESAINFLMATDNTQYIDQFWRKTRQLDEIRNENILEVLPELKNLL